MENQKTTQNEVPMKLVAFRIKPAEHELLRSVAKESNKTVTDVIREGLHLMLAIPHHG